MPFSSFTSFTSNRIKKLQVAKMNKTKTITVVRTNNIDLTISYEWNEDVCTSKCNTKATLK